ncbi:hypothetical protein [Rhizobium sp. P007]|uniref:hypothetical protein n=1 Tax=Rhizobium sp. P007 TaxID=285908 RepID=UPI00115B8DBC|nr:hypothetical protein [Rhizobium sp. P007]CAD7041229.1 hypothetical protein RP007_00724 [Rhizobium sp. P007]
MINHGHWLKYVPDEIPRYAPENAIFWQRGNDDWYEWSRSNWNIIQGKDASKTTKVAVAGDRVISAETDVTLLSLPTEFTLYELEGNETAPKPGWFLNGNEFVESL